MNANLFHFTFKLLFSLNFSKDWRGELKYTSTIIPIKIFVIGFAAVNKRLVQILNSFQTPFWIL